MVIRMDQQQAMSSPSDAASSPSSHDSDISPNLLEHHRQTLRRLHHSTPTSSVPNNNTRAEFKRLKTILPSIRRKERVSKLDIILEAIRYIDDLQDQLIGRLHGDAVHDLENDVLLDGSGLDTRSRREMARLVLGEKKKSLAAEWREKQLLQQQQLASRVSDDDDSCLDDSMDEDDLDDSLAKEESLELAQEAGDDAAESHKEQDLTADSLAN